MTEHPRRHMLNGSANGAWKYLGVNLYGVCIQGPFLFSDIASDIT